ncbi:MAG: HAD-IA family hydrolase [Spirochaetales bacterium]|nr:HAD-IA family hydrolase [Spirochaetales bacterium]
MVLPLPLFDLDNTLYPPSCGVLPEIDRRIDVFVADYFGVDLEGSQAIRRGKAAVYGTTLNWLMTCHGLTDPEPYLEAVHPKNLEDFIPQDAKLREFLCSLSSPLVLFTNSPSEHARRALAALGISDLFPDEWVWDLRRLQFIGKPRSAAYETILKDLGLSAHQAILIDDSPANLASFQDMGGQVVASGGPVQKWMSELTSLLGTEVSCV